MRGRRFRWHWPKTWLILQAVNTGMLFGVPLQLFGWDRAAVVVAVAVAFVLLVRGWGRLEAATPLYVHTSAEDDAAVKQALSMDAQRAAGSALRFLFPFAATLAIVAVAFIWALTRGWIGRALGLRSIPDWIFGWIGADLLVAGLAVVVNAYFAFERLDGIAGIWVNANHEAWSSFTARLGTFPLPKPTLIGAGYIVLGPFDIQSRNGPSELAAARAHLADFEHRVIPWPGTSYARASSEALDEKDHFDRGAE